MLNMTIDQIAFIAHSDEDEQRIKESLGLLDGPWTEDYCVARGSVFGVEGLENRAKLLFNYQNGIEVEILRYLEGDNYAVDIPGGQMCHIGMHYTGKGDVPTFGDVIAQRVETISHTNPHLLKTGRQYRYTIYDTLSTHGVYLKVIERI